MKVLALAAVLALSGCGSMFSKPAPGPIQYVPQEVKVPVPVKCKAPEIAKPTYSFNQAKKDDLLFNNIALLASENDSLNAYTIRLEAALKACSQ